VRVHDVEIESVAAIGSKCDALAIGRPGRLTLDCRRFGELAPLPPVRLHRPDAIEDDHRQPFAVGRPGWIAHAGRAGLRARAQRENRNEDERSVEAGL
jgi:hypothetical protein